MAFIFVIPVPVLLYVSYVCVLFFSSAVFFLSISIYPWRVVCRSTGTFRNFSAGCSLAVYWGGVQNCIRPIHIHIGAVVDYCTQPHRHTCISPYTDKVPTICCCWCCWKEAVWCWMVAVCIVSLASTMRLYTVWRFALMPVQNATAPNVPKAWTAPQSA